MDVFGQQKEPFDQHGDAGVQLGVRAAPHPKRERAREKTREKGRVFISDLGTQSERDLVRDRESEQRVGYWVSADTRRKAAWRWAQASSSVSAPFPTHTDTCINMTIIVRKHAPVT